jgi:hypothetical protein
MTGSTNVVHQRASLRAPEDGSGHTAVEARTAPADLRVNSQL